MLNLLSTTFGMSSASMIHIPSICHGSILRIDDDWRLRSRSLGTRFIPDDHTAETLSNAMLDMLDNNYWPTMSCDNNMV